MAVYVEVSLIAMHPLANVISEPADRENVSSPIQGNRVLAAEALAGEDLLVNRRESRIIGLEWMRSHLFNDNPVSTTIASLIRE